MWRTKVINKTPINEIPGTKPWVCLFTDGQISNDTLALSLFAESSKIAWRITHMQLEKENEYHLFHNFSTFPSSLFLSHFHAHIHTKCLLPRSVDMSPLSIDLELDATVHTHWFTHETRMKIITCRFLSTISPVLLFGFPWWTIVIYLARHYSFRQLYKIQPKTTTYAILCNTGLKLILLAKGNANAQGGGLRSNPSTVSLKASGLE